MDGAEQSRAAAEPRLNDQPLPLGVPGSAPPAAAPARAPGAGVAAIEVVVPDGGEDDLADPTPTPESKAVVLKNNFINPLHGEEVTIAYRLPEGGQVRLAVYNGLGELVTVLSDGVIEAGDHETVWSGADKSGVLVPTGIYFLSVETPSYRERHKIVVVK